MGAASFLENNYMTEIHSIVALLHKQQQFCFVLFLHLTRELHYYLDQMPVLFTYMYNYSYCPLASLLFF